MLKFVEVQKGVIWNATLENKRAYPLFWLLKVQETHSKMSKLASSILRRTQFCIQQFWMAGNLIFTAPKSGVCPIFRKKGAGWWSAPTYSTKMSKRSFAHFWVKPFSPFSGITFFTVLWETQAQQNCSKNPPTVGGRKEVFKAINTKTRKQQFKTDIKTP